MTFRLAVLLGFVAGFTDAATFVGADGLLSAHVTGNFVLMAASLGRGMSLEILPLLTLFVFSFAVTVATWAHSYFQKKRTDSLRPFILINSLLFLFSGLFFLAEGLHPSKVEPISWEALLLMFPVSAMGIQNAIHRLGRSTQPQTTVMTGNSTSVLIDFIKMLIAKRFPAKSLAKKPTAQSVLAIIFAFVLGCVIAAWATGHFGFGAFCIPGGVMATALFTEFNQKRSVTDPSVNDSDPVKALAG
jgi:uncharacterized membrane protein YoaK (UPF0700 family)